MALKLNNKADLRTLELDVMAALGEVLERHGISAKPAGGRFDPDGTSFTMKIEFGAAMTAGDIERKQRAEFESMCRWYDLEAGDFGARFTSQCHEFKLIGFNPGAPKFPLKAIRLIDGKPFKFTKAVVAQIVANRAKRAA